MLNNKTWRLSCFLFLYIAACASRCEADTQIDTVSEYFQCTNTLELLHLLCAHSFRNSYPVFFPKVKDFVYKLPLKVSSQHAQTEMWKSQFPLAVLAVSCYFSLYAYPNFSSKVACRHESGTDLRMQLLVKKKVYF